MRLLASQLRSPGPLVMATRVEPPTRTGPVMWPRWVGGKVVMTRIPAELIPDGWQSVNVHIPKRLGTCEEAGCDNLREGWTEITRGGTRIGYQTGNVSRDEAAQKYGYDGALSVPPTVRFMPPGTICPMAHYVSSGVPPLYSVNGRTVLWNEFEDSLGGGIERWRQYIQSGQ